MESKPKSQVWIVNLESQGLERKSSLKYSKQLASEYQPSQKEAIMLPVGYVIKHPNGHNSVEVFDSGFEVPQTLVARPIYDSVSVSHLEGELLTVIDASFTQKDQKEAVKSLIRQTIWRFNARKEREIREIFERS